MSCIRFRIVMMFGLLLVLATLSAAPAVEGDPAEWKKAEAGKHLDARMKAWFEWPSAVRGEGATKTSCVSCHSVLTYALARPSLRKLTNKIRPAEYESKILDQVKRRVENWKDLDTPKHQLQYDFSAEKKKEARGTEAVLNALILATDDQFNGRKTPSDATQSAFSHLWSAQAADGDLGDQAGSWDWLDFKLEPWESKGARYFGAALAAVAVGTAPGYYAAGADAAVDGKVKLLRGYLRDNLAKQNLHNRIGALWASVKLSGLLTKEEQKKIIDDVIAKQREDGGWSLLSLGDFKRSDDSPIDDSSDAYATGLVLHVFQLAGVALDDAKVNKGLTWLKKNQRADGGWSGVSLNKKRKPETHTGEFMADAATAFAVLALSHVK